MKQYHTKNMQQVFVVENLPKNGFNLKVEATDEEQKMLVEQLAVENVTHFSANLIISQWRRGGAHIEGTFKLDFTQTCIISLESFDTSLTEKIDQKFFATTKIPELNDKKEVEMLDNDLDPPEALVDGELDVFAYLVETLLLQIDAYPRAPDANLEAFAALDKFEVNQPDVETQKVSSNDGKKNGKKPTHKPFADLAKLMKDK